MSTGPSPQAPAHQQTQSGMESTSAAHDAQQQSQQPPTDIQQRAAPAARHFSRQQVCRRHKKVRLYTAQAPCQQQSWVRPMLCMALCCASCSCNMFAHARRKNGHTVCGCSCQSQAVCSTVLQLAVNFLCQNVQCKR